MIYKVTLSVFRDKLPAKEFDADQTISIEPLLAEQSTEVEFFAEAVQLLALISETQINQKKRSC